MFSIVSLMPSREHNKPEIQRHKRNKTQDAVDEKRVGYRGGCRASSEAARRGRDDGRTPRCREGLVAAEVRWREMAMKNFSSELPQCASQPAAPLSTSDLR